MPKPMRRHNRGYSGGFPLATGDRDYAQDIFRDQAYQEALTGIAYNDLTQQVAPYVINGLVAGQGTGHTMDISAGKAVVPFEVTIPDTAAAWTVPPSTTTANIDMVIDYAGVTGASLAGTVTDGATPNYVKLAYTETDGNTRARAKKAGTYAYEVYDAVTLTIDDTAPTATEINLLTFTTDGATVTVTDNGDTRIGSPFHMQNAVVFSQATFNDCIVRVAANQYKIRDDIKSIYCANLSGGYLMTGGTSPLSGGDTWGYIETNNCKQVIFESGATLHMGNERGYIEVNTDDCYLLNVNIIGTGTVASAIAQSFLLNADRVSHNNCKSSNRLSNASFFAFRGSSTATQFLTCEYKGCSVELMDTSGSDFIAFYRGHNMVNCAVENITNTSAGNTIGCYSFCYAMSNCIAGNITVSSTTSCYCFGSCYEMSSCRAYIANDSGGNFYAYSTCDEISGCDAFQIDSSAGDARGFESCDQMSSCNASQIDHSGSVAGKNAYGFNACGNVSACKASNIDTNGAGGEAYGFNDCEIISACLATTCNNGFNGCLGLSACEGTSNSAQGFSACKRLSACRALTNTTNGFNSCDEISSSFSDNNSSSGFSNCDRVNGSLSTNNTINGFLNCNQINTNRSTGNGTNYNNSFADFGAAQAAADTAVGGYNG